MRTSGHQAGLEVPIVMRFDEFVALLRPKKRPVILLEGTRNVPEEEKKRLTRFGENLARLLPGALFRSGNAPGADQLFGAGVCNVKPSRLQYVAPYRSHRVHARRAGTRAFSLDQLPKSEITTLMEKTLEASPKYVGLIKRYWNIGRWEQHAIKLAYLLRDTLKVVGSSSLKLSPATCGIFYVNESRPFSGGTGHTIRVCQKEHVPVMDQKTWLGWQVQFF